MADILLLRVDRVDDIGEQRRLQQLFAESVAGGLGQQRGIGLLAAFGGGFGKRRPLRRNSPAAASACGREPVANRL